MQYSEAECTWDSTALRGVRDLHPWEHSLGNLSRGDNVFSVTGDQSVEGSAIDMRRRWLFAVALVLALTLASCGAPLRAGGGGAQSDLPTMLMVTRSGGALGRLSPLFGGSTDAGAVQRLYHAIYALPHVPPGAVMDCPADTGVLYTLTFMDGGTVLLKATVNATGCQLLTLGSNDVRMTNDAFWALLARTAGMPATDIHS